MSNELNVQQKKVQKRSRLTLIVLLLVFMMPWFFAKLFVSNPEWQPGPKNNGVLYKPVVSLSEFNFSTIDGQLFGLEQLRGKWTLIYIGSAECADECKQTLLKARNGIIAQGAEGTRVRYIYISTDQQFKQVESLKKEYAGLILLTSADENSLKTLSLFGNENAEQVGKDNRLYLLDPAGNILMYYPAGFRDLGLMEDLKHLLKL